MKSPREATPSSGLSDPSSTSTPTPTSTVAAGPPSIRGTQLPHQSPPTITVPSTRNLGPSTMQLPTLSSGPPSTRTPSAPQVSGPPSTRAPTSSHVLSPPSSRAFASPPSSQTAGPPSSRAVHLPSSRGSGPASTRGALPPFNLVNIDQIEAILAHFLSPAVRKSIMDCSARQARVDLTRPKPHDLQRLLVEIKRGAKLFVREQADLERCIAQLTELEAPAGPSEIRIDVTTEEDVMRARSIGRDFCMRQLLSDVVQTKIVTIISELARNIVRYAGGGEILLRLSDTPKRGIEIIARDRGPGIQNLDDILKGKFRSRHGMGAGLRGTKALVDEFDVKTGPTIGTTVTARKFIG